jgi:hypothetical protein
MDRKGYTEMIEKKSLEGLCNTCRFWRENKYFSTGESTETGSCRRYAPHPYNVNSEEYSEIPNDVAAVWPWTMEDDFCGDWAEKKTIKDSAE